MSNKTKGKVIVTFLLLILVVGIEVLVPGFYIRLAQLATSKDAIVEYLKSFGHWAMIVSFILDVLVNASGFLPSVFISTANGLVFGLFVGILISWLAETTGVIISFIVLRYFFRDFAETIIQKSDSLRELDDVSGNKGFLWMLFMRAMPYMPSGLLTAVGAISKISLRSYVFANLIGKLPSTALEVLVGHDLVNLNEHYYRLTIWIIMIILAYGCVRWWKKRRSKC